jgi:hypothetical protein
MTSTLGKVGEGILQTTDISGHSLFPQEWRELPKSTESCYITSKGKIAAAVAVSLICNDAEPSSDEIKQVIDEVKAKGDPVAFLTPLSKVVFPDVKDGEGPTVKEYLEGSKDLSGYKIRCMLVSYPHYVESK